MIYTQVIGMKNALARLYGVSAGLIDLRVPLKKTQRYIEDMMKERFRKGGDPIKWKKVTETTLKLREVNKGNQPLIDRGNLLRAVSSPRSRYAKHTVFKNQLRFAISRTLNKDGVFYPALLEDDLVIEDGWGRGIRIEIPGRPYMYLTPKNYREINNIFHEYMEWLVSKPI